MHTIKDVSAWLGVAEITVWRWIRDGRVVAHKRSRAGRSQWVFDAAEYARLENVLAEQDAKLAPGLRERVQQMREDKLTEVVR